MEIINSVKVLKEKQTVNNYPYGSLRATAFFDIEFNDKKGFRSVFQTINPKNGRVNAPKKSTYNHFIYMYENPENGHVQYGHFNFHGYEHIEKFINFLCVNEIELNSVERSYIYINIINCIRGNARYTRLKEGVTNDQLIEATKFKDFVMLYKENAPLNELTKLNYSYNSIIELTA